MITRRRFLASGAAAIASLPLRAAAARSVPGMDAFDVVVVGSGVAGLSAALGALRTDPAASVVILEAGASHGGTSSRSGGRVWIPNNSDMRTELEDPRDMALRYMARLA